MNQRSTAPTKTAGSSDRTIFALLHAAHALEEKVEAALETADLSGPKFSVLSELVSAGEPLPLSELAGRLSCVRSNMTQLVDRLEADGLVQRVACPSDRRSVKAEITYLGRERQAAGAAAIARLHETFASAVSAADRKAFERMLKALA
ncbi:MAG TPA: MarR family transcriptional regulator [Gemmatimonadaceae bacterium]|nr:MarR family transcriptional regulator [Gemmatimonadaceae bacterium]